ncbi:MAG: TraB/GumN family protein [Saprospiraceae bacterium]|nr:TraB/GumN family protein [Saprospiraceae bacterium]
MGLRHPSSLWSVSLPDNRVVYLFGTIHLPIDAVDWNFTELKKLILQCDAYYGEMNLDVINEQGYAGMNLIPGGDSLVDLFSSVKKYEKVRQSILQSFNVDIDEFLHVRPLLIQHIIDRQISGGDGQVMDYALWNFCRNNKIPSDGLETLKDQFDILESIDLNYQISILKTIARNTSRYRKYIRKMIQLYNAQNIVVLFKKGMKSCGAYRQLLILDRNNRMAEKIMNIKTETTFISVGVGHLSGNKGILAHLKRAGAKVKPLH